jgi:CBS domain-containing protein
MKVKDMMHKGVECVSPDTAINAIAKRMRELDVGAIPVAADGKLVGMVTDRDIAIRCVADSQDISKVNAKDVMTSGVVYCRDNEDVEDAVRIMEGKLRRLPVLNEAMQMVGMVSLGDVSHALPRDITGEVAKAVSAHHG